MVPLPASTIMSVVTSAMVPLRIILYLHRALQHLYLHLTLCAFSLCVLTTPPLHSAQSPSSPSCPVSTQPKPPGSTTATPIQQTTTSGLTRGKPASSHCTQPTMPTHNRPLPPDPTTARPQTYPTLTFSSLNVGGVEITPNRLCHLLGGYQQPRILFPFRSIGPAPFPPHETTRGLPAIGDTTF